MKIQKKKTKFLLGFIDIYGSHIRGKSRLKKFFKIYETFKIIARIACLFFVIVYSLDFYHAYRKLKRYIKLKKKFHDYKFEKNLFLVSY